MTEEVEQMNDSSPPQCPHFGCRFAEMLYAARFFGTLSELHRDDVESRRVTLTVLRGLNGAVGVTVVHLN